MSDGHPIRLLVADDLRRSRLTVGFRLFLAIPHFLWLGLFGVVVAVAAFINWWATLFRGKSPRALHDFLAGYIRYATHVEAYAALAANSFPGFFTGSSLDPYPVDLHIDPPARQNRWKTGFRLVLVLPAGLMTGALAGGGGAGGRTTGYGVSLGLVATAAILMWFAALVRGRAPRGLRDCALWGLGYSAQTAAYLLLVTDRYPYSGPEGQLRGLEPAREAEERARLVVQGDLRRSRLTVLFRLLLALPHLVWLVLWTVAALPAAVANWLATLIRGRSPRPLVRFLGAYVRYSAHVSAFLYLIGNPFPGFVGAPGTYPVDVQLELSQRQNRWITGFRLPLAVPGFVVGGALGGLLLVAAFLGWFAALLRAWMPEGLRNAGAHAIRYNAQLSAYYLVLTDRYPYSGPPRDGPAPPATGAAAAAAG